MRLKKKRRLRGDRGQNADDDDEDVGEGYVVTLGSGQEDSYQASKNEASDELVERVPKKSKPNKRVRIAEEDPVNEEERVLKLLGSSAF